MDDKIAFPIDEYVKRLKINEGERLWTYDDANGQKVYPGYRLIGNATIGVGCLLDESGLSMLRRVGIVDPQAVLQGKEGITEEQSTDLLKLMVPRYVQYAREALISGLFDTMTPARQCALADMSYNLGASGLDSFITTLAFLDKAQTAKNSGQVDQAHQLFNNAADHLEKSLWYGQVHDRAKRDVVMLRVGVFCNPTGNGSDIV